MPTKRRPVRARLSLVPFTYRKWLLCGRPHALIYLNGGEPVRSLWSEYGELIIERHARRFPFHRPANFWRFDCAHDPRRPGESSFDYLVARPQLLTETERRRLLSQRQRLDHLRRELDDRSLG